MLEPEPQFQVFRQVLGNPDAGLQQVGFFDIRGFPRQNWLIPPEMNARQLLPKNR